jgi:hypothetical protein
MSVRRKVFAHVVFLAASVGVAVNLNHALRLSVALEALPALEPIDSYQYARFFQSPPLTPEQKRLLDSILRSRQSESTSILKLAQGTLEGWRFNSHLQTGLWAVVLFISGLQIWQLHRSNNRLQRTGEG